MNSGPLDIQPLAKARQIQEDDSSQQRQLEYHPEAPGPGSVVAASANAVHHAFARVTQPITQAGSAVYTPAVPQPGSAVYTPALPFSASANTIHHWAGDPTTSYARVARRAGSAPVHL